MFPSVPLPTYPAMPCISLPALRETDDLEMSGEETPMTVTGGERDPRQKEKQQIKSCSGQL